jgi:hypothetical protein
MMKRDQLVAAWLRLARESGVPDSEIGATAYAVSVSSDERYQGFCRALHVSDEVDTTPCAALTLPADWYGAN